MNVHTHRSRMEAGLQAFADERHSTARLRISVGSSINFRFIFEIMLNFLKGIHLL